MAPNGRVIQTTDMPRIACACAILLTLAVPMCLLYGISVGIATLHDRRVARRGPSIYPDLADDELAPIDDDEPAVP